MRLLIAMILLAGCSTDPCKRDTAFLTYTLPAGDEAADTIDVTITIGQNDPQTRAVPRKRGDSTLEIDFAAYPQSQPLTIELSALQGAVVLASKTLTPDTSGGCFTAEFDLVTVSDAGTQDLPGNPDAEPVDDFGNLPPVDLAVPPSVDLAFDPALAPSCLNLAPNCGKSIDTNCCESPIVSGGTYYRSHDFATDGLYPSTSSPATVSSFRLDKFEVTVGRFRNFLSTGAGTQEKPPAAGAGANPYIKDSGWQTSWNANLEQTRDAVEAALACDPSGMRQSWTTAAGANEDLPIDCASWLEAFAFCAWDGGFLATEAEWNYAAAGGADQRAYAWSTPAASLTISCAYGNYNPGSAGDNVHCVNGTTGGLWNVGSAPLGDGKWGQSDLDGNVYEWVLDWYSATYPTPCVDCAVITQGSATTRDNRGGGLLSDAPLMRTARRGNAAPTARGVNLGFRCARAL